MSFYSFIRCFSIHSIHTLHFWSLFVRAELAWLKCTRAKMDTALTLQMANVYHKNRDRKTWMLKCEHWFFTISDLYVAHKNHKWLPFSVLRIFIVGMFQTRWLLHSHRARRCQSEAGSFRAFGIAFICIFYIYKHYVIFWHKYDLLTFVRTFRFNSNKRWHKIK